MLTRLPNESDLAYHRRLIYGKLVDKTFGDVDYSELSIPVYGVSYSSDATRKAMYGSLKTLQLMDRESEQPSGEAYDAMEELERRTLELKKEQQKFYDQRTALNKTVREMARAEELNRIIQQSIAANELPSLAPVAISPAPWSCGDNDLLVSLNDLHYGADVDNYWCRYNPEICAAMMAEYAQKVIAIGRSHGSERCIVWANGDMISGSIHYEVAMSNRENLVKQVMGASELIAQFLAALSAYFSEVKFVSVAGNHSRIGPKDQSIMSERLDDLIQWYLKARMAPVANVDVDFGEKIDTTMYVMNVRGQNYVGVHGDYDPTPAHIQTLQQMVARPVHAVLLGHLHHNQTSTVQGVRTVMAGSFQGMDDYCVKRRIFGKPQQMVMVCGAEGIRCFYDVEFSTAMGAA